MSVEEESTSTTVAEAPVEQSEPVIKVANLSHSFKSHQALRGVSFEVYPSEIHGFVGPNGAGKTTTLKVLSTLLKPQKGVAMVFGMNVATHEKEVRRQIGFMPDHFSMYRQMTVFEYLDFFGAAYGLDLRERNQTINDVLALTDMDARKDDLIKGLSRGMQQRVSLARVLVHDPKLLLLDEPASGLDPRARIELMEILKELSRMGKTIFISSHILSELASLCNSVTILDRGQTKYCGSMKELLSHSHTATEDVVRYVLTTLELDSTVSDAIGEVEGVTEVSVDEEQDRYVVSFDPSATDTNHILQAVIAAGGQVTSFQQDVRHLNDVFMDLTEPGVRT